MLALDNRKGRYRKLVLADDRLVGAVLLGDLSEAARLRRLVEDGARVPPELLEGNDPQPLPIQGVVCSCANVTREQIDDAITTGGGERVSEVAGVTGAATALRRWPSSPRP